MSIFSDKIIQRGRGGIAAEEPALTLAEADFIIDPVALSATYSDGDPVTVADIFTNVGADAPRLALDGDWRVRFDGTQWLDGPTNLLDGLDGFMVAVAYEVPRLITDADTSNREFSLFASQAGSISNKPTRLALFQTDLLGDREDLHILIARKEQDEADEQVNPITQLAAGRALASFTHVLVVNVNLVTGVATLRKDGRLIHSRKMEATGTWALDGWANIIGRYVASTGTDNHYFHGDIKLMAGFYGSKSEAEAEAISDEMMGKFHTPLVIKIETEDRYDNLIDETNPTDFVQFKYARYAGRPILFRDTAGRIAVTDPGRHLVRAIRHPITGDLIMVHTSGDAGVWMGPDLGTLFSNGRYQSASDDYFHSSNYGDSPRSIFSTATQFDSGPAGQSIAHLRTSIGAGWYDEMRDRSSGTAKYSITHAGDTAHIVEATVDIEVRKNLGHTWGPASGAEIFEDGASVASTAFTSIVAPSGRGGVAWDGRDNSRLFTGLIEASSWYDRIVSAAEIAIIAEDL